MSEAFWDWYETGLKMGWCSEGVCETHDGLPWSEQECEDWQQGNDFCVPAVRLYGLEKVYDQQQRPTRVGDQHFCVDNLSAGSTD